MKGFIPILIVICLYKCWTINGFCFFIYMIIIFIFGGCILNMIVFDWVVESWKTSFFLFSKSNCENMYFIGPFQKLMFWLSSTQISYRITSISIDHKWKRVTHMLCIVSAMLSTCLSKSTMSLSKVWPCPL